MTDDRRPSFIIRRQSSVIRPLHPNPCKCSLNLFNHFNPFNNFNHLHIPGYSIKLTLFQQFP